jgi:hypothetical protein
MSTTNPLPQLLLASLNPQSRQHAGSSLNELSLQPGFVAALLRFVLGFDSGVDAERAVPLAGAVYLQNLIKLPWEEVRSFFSSHDSADGLGRT